MEDRVTHGVFRLFLLAAAIAAAYAWLPLVGATLLSSAACRRYARKGIELAAAILISAGIVAWVLLAHPHLDWRPGDWGAQIVWGVPLGMVAGFALSRRKRKILRLF
jgi:hypothetical protein